jgi:hypothetical protein
VADIRRREALVDSMNSVARMSDVGFGLSHGVIIARNSGDNGNPCAVKAQVRKANSAKKLVPFFRGLFWKIHELVPVLFLRSAYERDEVGMERRGVDAIAFCRKADRAPLEIDVPQRDSGFGDSATLSHCHEPRIIHPPVLFSESCFDFPLLGERDFRLLFWGDSSVSEFQAWVGVDVIPSNCFLENCGEDLQLCERGIEFSGSHNTTRWVRPELRIGSANLIRYLKWRDHIDVLQVRCNRRHAFVYRVTVFGFGYWSAKKVGT